MNPHYCLRNTNELDFPFFNSLYKNDKENNVIVELQQI